MTRHSRTVLIALAAGALILGVAFAWKASRGSTDTFPARRDSATSRVEMADFAGAATCAECHADQHRQWQDSTHGKAGGRPGEATIIAPFDGAPIVFADARVRPVTTADGAAFEVEWQGRAPEMIHIEGVVGGGHMEGGGTQGFFTRTNDGTLRFLPFDYSRHQRQWFCRASGEPVGRWIPITRALPLSACSDWPPRRTLGSVTNAPGCDQCHGSQIVAKFEPAKKAWVTEYASLAVNCEACHGPGRRHVELARAGRIAETADIGLTDLSTLDKRASVVVCLQCHGEKLALGAPPEIVTPGNFEDRYSVLFPMLTDDPYTVDFRQKKFGYQGPHLASACYLDGSMTCADCHDPHSQGYRDATWRPLAGRTDNGQCLACHASKGEDRLTAHTFHRPQSAGSQCVACHTPYLQHPILGDEIRYARADHTIPVPRPEEDARHGVTNACVTCHAGRTTEVLQAQVGRWWGESKPRHALVDGMIQASRTTSPVEAARLLLRPDSRAPMPQFAALSDYVRRFVRPDAGVGGVEARQALRELAASPDIDVSALALAALHAGDNGTEPEARQWLVDALQRDTDGRRRARWRFALEYLAFTYQASGDPAGAIRTFSKALELAPGDASVLEQLGGAQVQARDLTAAIATLTRATEADPTRALTFVMLGAAKELGGDVAGGLAAYVRAAELNPWDAEVQVRIARAHLGQKNIQAARPALERAVTIDRAHIGARLLLAQVLAATGDPRAALANIDVVLAFDPGNQAAGGLRARIRPQ